MLFLRPQPSTVFDGLRVEVMECSDACGGEHCVDLYADVMRLQHTA